MEHGSRRAIVAAFLANLGIAIAKFIGFAFTGAASMLAEAIHSVADTGNQGLLMLGGSSARRAATEAHPFGFGRARYFWSFVVALVLFTLGGLFAIFEGVEKLRHPHEVGSMGWAVGILGAAVVLEAFSLRTAVREAGRVRGGLSWWAFIRRAKTPELPVVLLEDVGALLGLVFALAGVGLAALTRDPRFDALGSLAIGVLLVTIAVVLMVEMKSLLIGESASPEDIEKIGAALATSEHVARVIHFRTEHLGPEEVLVAAKIEFTPGLPVERLVDALNAAETRVRAAVPIARFIYIEPDTFSPDRSAEAPAPRH